MKIRLLCSSLQNIVDARLITLQKKKKKKSVNLFVDRFGLHEYTRVYRRTLSVFSRRFEHNTRAFATSNFLISCSRPGLCRGKRAFAWSHLSAGLHRLATEFASTWLWRCLQVFPWSLSAERQVDDPLITERSWISNRPIRRHLAIDALMRSPCRVSCVFFVQIDHTSLPHFYKINVWWSFLEQRNGSQSGR